MPIMAAGYSGAVCVGFLVTRNALQRWNAMAAWPAHHIREMAVAIVSLLGIVRRGVAVDAARMRHNGIDMPPSR